MVRRLVTRRAPLARLAERGRGRARGLGTRGRAALSAAARRAEQCGASGWTLRLGCTDGNGSAICPLCSQPVRTRPDVGVRRSVQIIQEHFA